MSEIELVYEETASTPEMDNVTLKKCNQSLIEVYDGDEFIGTVGGTDILEAARNDS